MKRIIALVLSLLTVLSVCAGMSVSAKSGVPGAKGNEANAANLYASVLSLDNYKEGEKVSVISANKGVNVVSVKNTTPAPFTDNDVIDHHVEITGTGKYDVMVDAMSIDPSTEETAYIVIDTSTVLYPLSDVSKLSVFPILGNAEIHDECEYIPYNGTGYFKMKEPALIMGLFISVLEENFSWNVSEIFFCRNAYSAEYVIDNNVLPAEGTQKQLFVNDLGESTAICIANTSQEDFYHDLDKSKWPNIAVDENDTLYVAACTARSNAHSDLFGSAGMATSSDGGVTWSTPRRIFCSMAGCSPCIQYVGNGELIMGVSHRTEPNLINSDMFKIVTKGGELPADTDLCDGFDKDGYAVGGLYGNFRDLIKYYQKYDPEQYQHGYYYLHSYDYGKTWDFKPYEFKSAEELDDPNDVTEGMRDLADKYDLGSIEGLPSMPIDDDVHGPTRLYDGSYVCMGKEFERTFNPRHNETYLGYVTYASKNDCNDWNYLGKLKVPCDYTVWDFQEPDMCENSDGVLIVGFKSFIVFLAYSYDHGKTWTTPVQTDMQGAPCGLLTMPNGDIINTTDWRNDPTKIFGYVSEDGGRTWSTQGIIRTVGSKLGVTDMGYPSSVYLSDGTIVTSYYDVDSNIKVSRWKYELVDRKASSWAKNSTGWFYFDENCEIAKNQWIADKSGLCYVDANGYLVAGKSFKYNRKFYLADDNGHKVTKPGWQKAGGNWYYVASSDGVLKTDCWMKDSKGWCFLLSSGIMATNRSVKDSKGYCLVDASGYWVTKPGWQKAGSDWYYVEKGGYLKTSGWMKDSKGWCYLDNEGKMMTNTTLQDSKGWCCVDGSGYWVTKQGWKQIGSDWVYVQTGGYLKTKGWMKDSQGWCYLGNNGYMLKNTAVKDSKGWAFLDASGYWVTEPQYKYVTSSYMGGLPSGYYEIDKDGYLQPVELR